MLILFLIILAIFVAIIIYWEFWISEGAHLGSGVVVRLYDWTATRYDGIKQFDPAWEQRTLGEPLAAAARNAPWIKVLDVGAGTGRVARTLLPRTEFEGRLICLEPSRPMLELGIAQSPVGRLTWLQGLGDRLPFASLEFDIITLLEVLEFTPSPRTTIAELYRVLHPGGWLLITNRVGPQAKWILGRFFDRSSFEKLLMKHGFERIETIPWQVEYDLVWAQRPPDHSCSIGSE